ncbi:MAG: hypothetical protein KIT20_04920 [Alphaproteobacteria bacterium]|nr:hypothetical protein [Alphaproteobacteria bacterium]
MSGAAGLGDRLRRLLGLSGETGPDDNRAAAHPKVAPTDSPEGGDELFQGVLRAVPDRGALSTGRVHLLDIAPVRERLGERWETMSGRILVIAEGILKNYLGRRDLFSRVGETGFVLVFADLDPETGQVKCGLILKHILERLLGVGETPERLSVTTVVGERDGRLLTITVDALGAASGAASPGTPSPDWQEMAPPRRAPAPSPRAAAASLHLPDDLHFVYMPMWNCQYKAITTYLCLPRSSALSRVPHLGYAILPGGVRSSVVPHLDLAVMHQALRDGEDMLRAGRKSIISVTVHARTLETAPVWEEYRAIAARLPEELRKLLVFELVGLDRGASKSRIGALTGALRPFCRRIFYRGAMDDEDFERLRYLGIDGISLLLQRGKETEAELLHLFDRFAGAARRAGFASAVHGLSSRSLTIAAIGAGFDHVDGSPVRDPVKAPDAMERFGIEDLYG